MHSNGGDDCEWSNNNHNDNNNDSESRSGHSLTSTDANQSALRSNARIPAPLTQSTPPSTCKTDPVAPTPMSPTDGMFGPDTFDPLKVSRKSGSFEMQWRSPTSDLNRSILGSLNASNGEEWSEQQREVPPSPSEDSLDGLGIGVDHTEAETNGLYRTDFDLPSIVPNDTGSAAIATVDLYPQQRSGFENTEKPRPVLRRRSSLASSTCSTSSDDSSDSSVSSTDSSSSESSDSSDSSDSSEPSPISGASFFSSIPSSPPAVTTAATVTAPHAKTSSSGSRLKSSGIKISASFLMLLPNSGGRDKSNPSSPSTTPPLTPPLEQPDKLSKEGTTLPSKASWVPMISTAARAISKRTTTTVAPMADPRALILKRIAYIHTIKKLRERERRPFRHAVLLHLILVQLRRFGVANHQCEEIAEFYTAMWAVQFPASSGGNGGPLDMANTMMTAAAPHRQTLVQLQRQQIQLQKQHPQQAPSQVVAPASAPEGSGSTGSKEVKPKKSLLFSIYNRGQSSVNGISSSSSSSSSPTSSSSSDSDNDGDEGQSDVESEAAPRPSPTVILPKRTTGRKGLLHQQQQQFQLQLRQQLQGDYSTSAAFLPANIIEEQGQAWIQAQLSGVRPRFATSTYTTILDDQSLELTTRPLTPLPYVGAVDTVSGTKSPLMPLPVDLQINAAAGVASRSRPAPSTPLGAKSLFNVAMLPAVHKNNSGSMAIAPATVNTVSGMRSSSRPPLYRSSSSRASALPTPLPSIGMAPASVPVSYLPVRSRTPTSYSYTPPAQRFQKVRSHSSGNYRAGSLDAIRQNAAAAGVSDLRRYIVNHPGLLSPPHSPTMAFDATIGIETRNAIMVSPLSSLPWGSHKRLCSESSKDQRVRPLHQRRVTGEAAGIRSENAMSWVQARTLQEIRMRHSFDDDRSNGSTHGGGRSDSRVHYKFNGHHNGLGAHDSRHQSKFQKSSTSEESESEGEEEEDVPLAILQRRISSEMLRSSS
ncbi:hypothetical protein BGZ99_002823 [Dissophora globulifera]|uniref:Uncharacterized protein n=1 Tax=Dissophora globulifera TaxID=979702 RepID=A0A9P6V070_9FUNG|nr:hypothetical protein BGZ99_002823 [Dissophora globulifera]